MTNDDQSNQIATSPTNSEAVRSGDWLGDGSKLRTEGTRAMKKWRSEIEWHEQPTVEQKWIFLSGYEAGRRAQAAESPSAKLTDAGAEPVAREREGA